MGVITGGHLVTRGYRIPIGVVNSTLVADALHKVADHSLFKLVRSMQALPECPAIYREWSKKFDWTPEVPSSGVAYCIQASDPCSQFSTERHALIYVPPAGERRQQYRTVSITTLALVGKMVPQICKNEQRTMDAVVQFLEIFNRLYPDLPDLDNLAGVPA